MAGIVGFETGGVAAAPESERTEFLRMVGLWVFGGMMLAYAAAAGSAVTVLMFPVMQNRLIWLPIFFGTFAFSHYVAKQMVQGEFKEIGFALGCISEGIALGFLMLSAVMTSTEAFGAKGFGPFTILGEAALFTLLATAGMTAWLWAAPRELSMVGAALSVLCPPMLGVMIVTALYPIGGMAGIGIGMLFVAISAGGLLYSLNQVLHQMRADQHIEAAYELTMGLLVLFWNVIVLLMRLQRRFN